MAYQRSHTELMHVMYFEIFLFETLCQCNAWCFMKAYILHSMHYFSYMKDLSHMMHIYI